jgi:hypothetical protein
VLAPDHLPVAWCPFPLFRPLGLVIRYVVLNTGLLFISLFVALCVKLDPGTHKGNASSFGLQTGCDRYPGYITPTPPCHLHAHNALHVVPKGAR